jgi:hypothetical protein
MRRFSISLLADRPFIEARLLRMPRLLLYLLGANVLDPRGIVLECPQYG